jgi:hypothetical protein
MDHPAGAGSQWVDRVLFDPRVWLEFRGAQISYDGGLLVMRELDDVLELTDLSTVLKHTVAETEQGGFTARSALSKKLTQPQPPLGAKNACPASKFR